MPTKAGQMDATTTDVTVATTETTIAHGLSHTPNDAFILRLTTGARVWRGATAWNTTNIFLQASTQTTARLFIF